MNSGPRNLLGANWIRVLKKACPLTSLKRLVTIVHNVVHNPQIEVVRIHISVPHNREDREERYVNRDKKI